jgi:hypothetical protein
MAEICDVSRCRSYLYVMDSGCSFALELTSLRDVGHPACTDGSQADHQNRREKYYELPDYRIRDDLLSQRVARSERSFRKGDTYENDACARES